MIKPEFLNMTKGDFIQLNDQKKKTIKSTNPLSPHNLHTKLEDGAHIVIVGGGPAGSFFAIEMLRKAKAAGKKINVTILERKAKKLEHDTVVFRDSCNFCAGGISPKMYDLLKELKLSPPREVIQGQINSITLQSHWKNIVLKPWRVNNEKTRRMFTVYRGAKPKGRSDDYYNFDSFLLNEAVKMGAQVISAKAEGVSRDTDGMPQVHYGKDPEQKIKGDFVVMATGVNRLPGRTEKDRIIEDLEKLMPGFKVPATRKTLIFELEVERDFIDSLNGAAYYIEYGSKDLKIELCSITPKGNYLTVVIVGPDIDSRKSSPAEIIAKFLALPQVNRIFPRNLKLKPACMCTPNIVVGTAQNPCGDRIAAIGDLVTMRLNKDGIISTYRTANALAQAIFTGIDRKSLKENYLPLIKEFSNDNWFGQWIYFFNKIIFGNPVLSRIFYQAVMSERKVRVREKRKLEKILWQVASGDGTYKEIFFSMIRVDILFSILIDGLVVTFRNLAAELVFGLDWSQLSRHTTALYKEEFDGRRSYFKKLKQEEHIASDKEFESMYTIGIRQGHERVLKELGKFGDPDRKFLRPRFIKIHKVSGTSNEVGCVIRYEILHKSLSFDLELERIIRDRYMIYRVKNGFARDGVLIFDVHENRTGATNLSVYVGFDIPKGKNIFEYLFWKVFKFLFPFFVHDVIWNHSLCKIKDLAEEN